MRNLVEMDVDVVAGGLPIVMKIVEVVGVADALNDVVRGIVDGFRSAVEK